MYAYEWVVYSLNISLYKHGHHGLRSYIHLTTLVILLYIYILYIYIYIYIYIYLIVRYTLYISDLIINLHMPHPPSYCNKYLRQTVFLWTAVSVLSEGASMGHTCIVFDLMGCITGGNMALYLNEKYTLFYYHVDAYRSIILECSYFTCPDYLVVQVCIRAMLLHPINILLAGPNIYYFFKFFPGQLGTITQRIL